MPSLSLSVSDKLLLAAYDLEKEGKMPFTAEDLVVAAWRRYPDAFGLAGYNDDTGSPAHPDSNRVFAEIMGTKPIRKRGFLRKVGTKIYQLTEAGRDQAKSLLSQVQGPTISKASLPRDLETELKRLMTSRASVKFRGSRKDDISFYDACTFWGITPRSSAIELEGRIANFTKVAQRALETVTERDASFEHGGPSFSRNDVELLLALHRLLLNRFTEEIAVIQRRTDERA